MQSAASLPHPAPGDGPRIGVFGGTFDPLHVGHLAVALDVRHALDLDRMLLVVANDPWQKSDRTVTPAAHRLAMARAGVDACNELVGEVVVEVSSIEVDRGGETYTADTLEQLHDARPEASFFLLVGSDAAAGLPTWKRPEAVRALATTVVVERGGDSGGRPPDGWPHLVVPVPALEISASDIRARCREGRPVAALVAPGVLDEIRRHGLYGVSK